MKKDNSIGKKIILAIAVTVVSFAVVIGVVYGVIMAGRGKVIVIPVSDVDYGFGGSYGTDVSGTVSSGSSQTVTLSAERAFAELYVGDGDNVAKGDALVKYDTESYEQKLAQSQIDLMSAQIRLESANTKLTALNNATKVVSTPEDNSEANEPEEGEGEETEEYNDTSVELYSTSDGSIYTASELRTEKNTVNDEIRSLSTSMSECQNKIDSLNRKINDSTVYAAIDGVVATADSSLLNTEIAEGEDSTSFSGQAPVIVKVTSNNGVYVNTYISEFNKSKVSAGDAAYVSSWVTGEVYKASVTNISEYASESYSGYMSDGTDSISYYPMTVLLDDKNISLAVGSDVEVSLTKPADYVSDDPEENDSGEIYLYKAFVLDEKGSKYVYISKKGKLTKKKIKVSGQSADTYIVTEGISGDDYIAFPYGDNIKVGAKVKKGTIDMLYGD